MEAAAKLLGKTWLIQEDSESPDFIISETGTTFGLEVAEIFNGTISLAGSARKTAESDNQKAINKVKQEYEKATNNTPLDVKLVGKITSESLTTIVPALLKADIASHPPTHQEIFETLPGFKIYATRSLRPNWYSVLDKVGFVDRNPIPVILETINNKAAKIPQYRENAGQDIRLLLFANRIQNSGKLKLVAPISIDNKGFNTVYFLSYPEEVTVFQTGKESLTLPG